MNSLKNYFSSPMKSVSNVAIANTSILSPTFNIMSNIPVANFTSIKISKTDGRKIIKNMEEVLNSVKKKHKNKHKHRRKNDTNIQKLQTGQQVNEVSGILFEDDQQNIKPLDVKNVDLNIHSLVSTSKEHVVERGKNNKKNKNLHNFDKTKTANKKSVDISENYLSASNEVLLKSEKTNIEIAAEIDADITIKTNQIASQQKKKKNAFEFMMNARNKSIGGNSPGKFEILVDNIENENMKSVKAKRKIFLEEWAEQKGAKKRKLNEEKHDEYVEHLLTKRAIRLKKMIVNSPTKNPSKNQIRNKTAKSNINNVVISQQNTIKEKLKHINSHLSDSENSEDTTLKQNIEFVAKLSSPIKKRDSLLGYFEKTISPNTNENTNTKKKSSKRNTSENLKMEIPGMCSSKNRPQRSCSRKNRYDYKLDQSPKKLEKKKSQFERKSTKYLKLKKIIVQEDTDVICLDNNSSISSKSKKSKNDIPKILAPLFVKTMPKPNIDPKILEARHAFLMSGVPEKMKQEIAKQKQFEETFEASIELFPKICHVPQWEHENIENVKWEDCGIRWINEKLSEKNELLGKKKQRASKFKSITDFKYKKTHLMTLTSLPQVKNKITLIKSWKNLYDKFPTYKCYNQLREKYRFFGAMDTALDTQEVAESIIVTNCTSRKLKPKLNINEENDELPPESAPNGELLFTEKYKPMSSQQILVNLTPVNTLKEFLCSWQDDRREQKLNNSFDDFDINNDSNSSINNTSNAIVLLGPNSSGKTQAVFALADELNFNILEINAGMKRTGKKLLQELQEATQSHQIRKDSKGNLIKKSMNGIMSQKMDINFDSSSSGELSCSGKMSLILVEDADITFDQYDAGYIDAIYQLASISKRPVVIIANNRNCPYLLRLINLNSIEFLAPNALNISKFLSILSLIENCPIDLDEIISLYLFNNMDIRKTILEIQFFIQSGGDRIKPAIITKKSSRNQIEKYYASPTKRRLSSEFCKVNDECMFRDDINADDEIIYTHNTLFELFTRSQNVNTIIPFPVNLNLLWTNLNGIFQNSKSLLVNHNISLKQKHSKIPQVKTTSKNGLSSENQVLNSLVDFYDNVSVAACLGSKEIDDRLSLNLEEEISHLLIEDSIRSILKTKQCSYNLFVDNLKQRINLIPSTANIGYKSRSKCLDYEASLRSICRSEKIRSSLERRSTTRFYHYLRNNYIKMDSFSTELFDKACHILIDYIEIDNTANVIAEQQENC